MCLLSGVYFPPSLFFFFFCVDIWFLSLVGLEHYYPFAACNLRHLCLFIFLLFLNFDFMRLFVWQVGWGWPLFSVCYFDDENFG